MRELLIEGEYHHVYNRGAHKQTVFTCDDDYRRFQMLMYLLNTEEQVVMRDILSKYKDRNYVAIFTEEESQKALVEIVAYCLMPNHFHLVLRQKAEGGITRFMKKLCIAYSMYFTTKYEHSGVMFQGRFKSKHINEESYFRWIFAYIHLNPLDVFEPGWKERGLKNVDAGRKFLARYRYSSHIDYNAGERPERNILSYEDAPEFLKKENDVEILCRWLEDGMLEAST